MVNPNSSLLTPKEGFHWSKLLINLALKMQLKVLYNSMSLWLLWWWPCTTIR